MKKIILAVIVCIIAFGAFGCTKDSKIIDTETFNPIEFKTQQQSTNAGKILYDFALEELLQSSLAADNQIDCPTFNIENTYAYEYDINSDGQNEIIGKINSAIHCGAKSCAFYILQKQNGRWKLLSKSVLVPVVMQIEPLESKSNGYKDFQIKDKQTGKISTIVYDKQNNTYIYK